MYDLLYSTFPRQVAYPYRKTVDRKEFYSTINRLNGKVRLFSSVYNFTGSQHFDKISLDLDKIFFDFDGPEAFENTMAFTFHLRKANLKHLLLFSGGGYHVYLFTKGYENLKNKKACLTNVHDYFLKEYCCHFDKAIFGDIARVATIPNTWNTKRQRYCIPIFANEIIKGFEYHSNLAKEQRFEFEINGEELFDVSGFDSSEESSYEVEVTEEVKAQIDSDEILSQMPPCIASLLANASHTRVGWRGRFLLIVYLRDSGILYGNACDIITRYLTAQKRGVSEAVHCIREERQAKHIYERDESLFPSCESLRREGFCRSSRLCAHCKKGDSGSHILAIYR